MPECPRNFRFVTTPRKRNSDPQDTHTIAVGALVPFDFPRHQARHIRLHVPSRSHQLNPMSSFWRAEPRSIKLRQELDALPPIAECDKSRRLQLLERLVSQLSEENEILRRKELQVMQRSSTAPSKFTEPARSYSIVFSAKGSLFTHVECILADVDRQCPGVQWTNQNWTKSEDPDGHQSTDIARVLFFRIGQRVSESDFKDFEKFCVGKANFVVFMHNEMRDCDSVGVETYVIDRISSLKHTTTSASMAFKEHALYPISEGLNAASLAKLVSFVKAQAPRA